MDAINRQMKLIAYATGLPDESNFAMSGAPLSDPKQGEIVVRVHFLSMDPFPRLRMSGNAAVAPQLPLDSVMIGRGVGQVIASRHPDFEEGVYVAGELGWQEYCTSDGTGLRPVNPSLGPISASLGVLGPSGLAAYFATLRQGHPGPGETLVIDAASGAVASIAGQIAKLQGARVVGIAGGEIQTKYVIDELDFDAAVDYKATQNLSQSIGAACADGVDVFLDLVGGEIHDAVMNHINVGVRIVLIGTISNYNQGANEIDTGPRHLYTWIKARARISGFLVGDYAPEFDEALQTLASWLQSGKIKYRETIFEGLDRCAEAFAALFGTEHVGKLLVKVSND